MTKKSKFAKKLRFWITFFIGTTLAYFLWISWSKLTYYVGEGWIVWAITGSIVLIGIFSGFWSWKKITKEFIN